MKKILIALTLLWSTISYADIEDYDFFTMNMPMLCGLPATVDKYIEDNKFVVINMSFGKENGKQDGEILFAIKYQINDKYQTIAVAETPTDPTKCILFVTFDMIMNTKLLNSKDIQSLTFKIKPDII